LNCLRVQGKACTETDVDSLIKQRAGGHR
jgi:hypothetical protein